MSSIVDITQFHLGTSDVNILTFSWKSLKFQTNNIQYFGNLVDLVLGNRVTNSNFRFLLEKLNNLKNDLYLTGLPSFFFKLYKTIVV